MVVLGWGRSGSKQPGGAGDQVHFEEVSPERRVGVGVGGDQVPYAKHTDRTHRVPIHFDPIEGKPSWTALDLVDNPILRAEALPEDLEVNEMQAPPGRVEGENARLRRWHLGPDVLKGVDSSRDVHHHHAAGGRVRSRE